MAQAPQTVAMMSERADLGNAALGGATASGSAAHQPDQGHSGEGSG